MKSEIPMTYMTMSNQNKKGNQRMKIPSDNYCKSPIRKQPRGKAGFGTVEIVLIIAVLISLALLFRTAITSYATHLITSVFGDQSILTESSEGED